MKLKLACLCVLGLASFSAAACYTVYDRAGQVVYNAQTPPVDMSRPIHETLPSVYPGTTMVFDLSSNNCPVEQGPRMRADPPPAKPSPLLTDRKSAAAMNVPHVILPSGVALVSNPPVMSAGISVIPGEALSPVIAPAVTAHRSRRPATVITEMYNPPLTVVQQGGMILESR